jgi:hypothetical protein
MRYIRRRPLPQLLKEYYPLFQNYGMIKEQIIEEFRTRKKYVGAAGDFIWEIFQLILTAVAKAYKDGKIGEEQFYRDNRDIYNKMWMFMGSEGRDPIQIQTAYYLNDIKYSQIHFKDLQGFKIFCVSCCSACDYYHNKELSIDEALEHARNTATRCANKYKNGCRTTYIMRIPDTDTPSWLKITLG